MPCWKDSIKKYHFSSQYVTTSSLLTLSASGAEVHVLLFDNHLPPGVWAGWRMIRRARALAHSQQAPIITLYGNAGVEMSARRAGSNAFLRKLAGIPLSLGR